MAGRLFRGAWATHARRDLPSRTRRVARYLTAALVLAGLGGVAVAVSGGSAAQPPNILLIVTDDQRAGNDTMQVMPKTLQWFGDGGTEFTSAYATTTACCPSRASIFSGR